MNELAKELDDLLTKLGPTTPEDVVLSLMDYMEITGICAFCQQPLALHDDETDCPPSA